MKKCTGDCKELKSLDEFYANKYLSDGHVSKCKVCINADMATYRKANLEKVREQGRIGSQKYRDNHPYNER